MEMPGLTLGPPVVYVPVYPADHLGGPRGYVRRPEGDKTQYLVAAVKRPESQEGEHD